MRDTSSAFDGEAVDISGGDHTFSLSRACRGIYVGVEGDVAVQMDGQGDPASPGSNLTFTNVPAGTILPVRARKVLQSGTDADDMVMLV